MSGVSYCCLAGQEIASGNRTLTYVRAIGDPRVAVSLRSPLIPEPAGPVPENLSAFCAAMEDSARPANEATYPDPATDDAPWYTAGRPESAEFLGVHLTEVRVGNVIARSASPRYPVGGTVGNLQRTQRVVSCAGSMYASTERGMRYGERWLTAVLAGSDCDRGDDLTLLLACDDGALRTVPWAGIVDGPTFTEWGGVPDCVMQQVAFQLASPLPWLLHEADVWADADVGAAETFSEMATGPTWTGDVAVVVEVTSGGPDPVTDIRLTVAYPVASECPTANPPFVDATVPSLPPNRTLRIDSARREVTVTETSSGRVVGGMDLLTFDGLWRWAEIGACTTACVTVSFDGAYNADTHLTASTVEREL